ncbi:phage tail sheath family protein [bacterium]|nr:phage tail sheath family protein [bacterium]
MASNIKTPGVYINEINGFPNSVVPIATSVPAFIGYTPKAEYQGKSYTNKAQKITSFSEFQAFYMLEDSPAPADPAVQYHPDYHLVVQDAKPEKGDCMMIGGKYYSILPDPNTIFYLYNSLRLFFQNGGGDAYVVSIGGYGKPSKKPQDTPGEPIVNPNVKLADFQRGLELLKNEQEPTMYICPEATLLNRDDNATLMQSMLLQAEEMQTTLCIFDIIGGQDPDPILYTDNIEAFRNSTGNQGLKYGTCYYPFVGTTIIQSGEINYTNLFAGNIKELEPLLSPPSAPNQSAEKILSMIENQASGTLTTSQLNGSLLNVSKTYVLIIDHVIKKANVLPPSGAMAGVYTVNDNQNGVWHAPANMSIVGVVDLPIRLSDSQQEGLNVDAISGKSVNAIRFFIGQGILVWGARTLDGNSQDWRYVAVRRTMTYLEQSVKAAARAYIFEPNDANTWAAVKSMISSFLTSVWKEGGLQGASAADAYSVEIGLGTTMTAEDLLNGFMNVTVKVAVVHPAEFIVITFQQQMPKSG